MIGILINYTSNIQCTTLYKLTIYSSIQSFYDPIHIILHIISCLSLPCGPLIEISYPLSSALFHCSYLSQSFFFVSDVVGSNFYFPIFLHFKLITFLSTIEERRISQSLLKCHKVLILLLTKKKHHKLLRI